ncbi:MULTISPECIES: hypothetical protein [Candidatus Cardinium]|uniref:hypothetical protein n=1 Tax=Candidatus Cardinium TaxID=273135 RepID=UPI001FA9BCE0|nr:MULTISPECIES: hypothetical protein [Cardinium]
MQYALKITTLLIVTVFYTFCSVRTFGANRQMDRDALRLQKENVGMPQETNAPVEKEAIQVANEALPLVKVAHKDVMDLLYLFFVPKPMYLPSYIPLLQQVGIRINWAQCLKNCWSIDQKSYGGGVDIYFCGPIQLSIDVGYLADQPKNIIYGNKLPYTLKGSYGLGGLLCMMHPNRLTNAYCGIGYGYSRFNLIYGDDITSSNPFVAGWIKLLGGSELSLVPQLYGGMQLGIAYLMHGKKNDDRQVSNYTIPGYGKVANKIEFDITLYLKWSISFLEKKIVL